jgi:hypothetical protein
VDEAKGLPLAEKLLCKPFVGKLQLIGSFLVAQRRGQTMRDVGKEIEAVTEQRNENDAILS